MKKRILSLALALVLALGLCVTGAAAADVSDYPIWFSNVNTSGVMQGGEGWYWPDFEVPGTDLYVQAVSAYHYNYGNGAAPGWIGIYDWDTDECVGEWQAVGRAGNKWWDVYPNITLEGGRRYYVVTTDEDSWSYNAASGYHGFIEVRGYTTGGDVPSGGGAIPPSRQTAAVEVMVNGAYVQWTDAWPFIDANSRTLVPLRAVGEAMGLAVGWDGNAREASFTDGSRAIYFPIDSRTARTGGGGQIPMDTAAVIVNDRTYAPVRYLAEFFGFHVDWDGANRTVLITGSVTPAWDPWASDDYSFAGMGIDADVDNHGQKAYRTITDLGTSITCYAKVSSYRVFAEDDAMPGFPGYEWRVMTIDVTAPANTDSDRQQYFLASNYYDIKQHEDSWTSDDSGVQYFETTWNGQTVEYSYWYRVENQTGSGFRLVVTAQVPTGFDGLVVGFINADLADQANSMYLYQYYTGVQDFALFRMK